MAKPFPKKDPPMPPLPTDDGSGAAKALAKNVAALMQWAADHNSGPSQKAPLARAADVARTVVDRILAGGKEGAPGIDAVEQVAKVYNLEAWQLLVPGWTPPTPPILRPATAAELELYRSLAELREKLDMVQSERENLASAADTTPANGHSSRTGPKGGKTMAGAKPAKAKRPH